MSALHPCERLPLLFKYRDFLESFTLAARCTSMTQLLRMPPGCTSSQWKKVCEELFVWWKKKGCRVRSSNAVGRVQPFPGWSHGTGGVMPAARYENMKILLGLGNENNGLLEMLNSVLSD